MINLIKIIVMAIFSLLPDSPFQAMCDSVIFDKDFLPFLNWYIPFDICATMTLAWLSCVLTYYTFVMVKKIIYDFIINKILEGIIVGLSGFTI